MGAIALAPLQPLDHGATLPAALTSTHAVQLAAFDVVTPWLNVINNASLNIANLANSALGPNASNSGDGQTVGAPLPILQQTGANQLKFLTELPDISTIFTQFFANVGAAVKAPWQADLTTLSGLHPTAYTLIPTLAPNIPQSLLDLTTTSGAGILAGLIGPVVGPALVLSQSITAIITKIKAGADFAALAKEKSTDPAAANGGDLGFFKAEDMLPEFSTMAFSLKPGEVSSKPVQTRYGWHVIKVEERRQQPAPTFEEVHDQLRQQMIEDGINKTVTAARAQVKIERFNPDGTPVRAPEAAAPAKKP